VGRIDGGGDDDAGDDDADDDEVIMVVIATGSVCIHVGTYSEMTTVEAPGKCSGRRYIVFCTVLSYRGSYRG
jgi:hypothetical protein